MQQYYVITAMCACRTAPSFLRFESFPYPGSAGRFVLRMLCTGSDHFLSAYFPLKISMKPQKSVSQFFALREVASCSACELRSIVSSTHNTNPPNNFSPLLSICAVVQKDGYVREPLWHGDPSYCCVDAICPSGRTPTMSFFCFSRLAHTDKTSRRGKRHSPSAFGISKCYPFKQYSRVFLSPCEFGD